MPHKCTNCDNVFEDGSDDILSGCDCGNLKFEYVAEDRQDTESRAPQTSANSEEPTAEEPLDDSLIIAEEEPVEDETQHKARSEVVSDDDLPQTGSSPTTLGSTEEEVEKVRQELHDQFEGIRILEPGNYQINLMKVYEKQECVISLQEDGRYIINVPGMMESEVTTDD